MSKLFPSLKSQQKETIIPSAATTMKLYITNMFCVVVITQLVSDVTNSNGRWGTFLNTIATDSNSPSLEILIISYLVLYTITVHLEVWYLFRVTFTTFDIFLIDTFTAKKLLPFSQIGTIQTELLKPVLLFVFFTCFRCELTKITFGSLLSVYHASDIRTVS